MGLYQGNADDLQWKRKRKKGIFVFVSLVVVMALGFTVTVVTAGTFVESLNNMALVLMSFHLIIKTVLFMANSAHHEELKEQSQEIVRVSFDVRFKNAKLEKQLHFTMRLLQSFYLLALVILIVHIMVTVYMGRFPYDIFESVADDGSAGAYASAVYSNVVFVYAAIIYVTQNMLPLVYVSYVIGFLDDLAERLKCVGVSKSFDYDELVQCIKIHQLINKYFGEMHECYKWTFLVQNILSQFMICTYVFNLSTSKDLNTIILSLSFVILMTFEIFLPCFYGSELKRSSENLTDAIYMSDWLNCEIKTKKMIVIFTENLKQPMQISYHHLVDVNLESFALIIDAAYSFYCVMSELAN